MPHFPKPFFKKARGVWYVEIDRRQINLGPDKDAAFEQYHKLMSKPRVATIAATRSLAALIDAFLEWTQRNRAPDTYEWYRYRLQRFVDRYPDLTVEQLRPYHAEHWANSYPLSTTSRRNYLRSIKRCLKWAKRQGYIDENPITDLELPRAENREIAITPAEFARLLEFVRNDDLRELVTVTWETGCRPQESLRVESRHVDIKNQRWVFPLSESKMKRSARVVYLTDTAFAITLRRVKAHSEGPLFRNSRGKAWTTDAVNCAFQAMRLRMAKDAMKQEGVSVSEEDIVALTPELSPTKFVKGVRLDKSKAELRAEAKQKLQRKLALQYCPPYSLYALRHSWATNALKRGVDPLTVAILMGHRDPSTLARVYQHLSLSPDHLLNQAKRAAS
jgi:integrase